MRIVRTEMYFEASVVKWVLAEEDPAPGMSVAWLHFEGVDEPLSAADMKELFRGEYSCLAISNPLESFRGFAELALQAVNADDASPILDKLPNVSVQNEAITKAVLQTKVVYEASPPHHIDLGELLKSVSTGVAIGTPIGIYAGGSSFPVMVGSVMLSSLAVGVAANLSKGIGIIIIGAAKGVSRGLEEGLAQKVRDLIVKKKKSRGRSA